MSKEKPNLTHDELDILQARFPTMAEYGLPIPPTHAHKVTEDWLVIIGFSCRVMLDRANMGFTVGLLTQSCPPEKFQVIGVADDDGHPIQWFIVSHPDNPEAYQIAKGVRLHMLEEPWINREWYLKQVSPLILACWIDMPMEHRLKAVAETGDDPGSVMEEVPPNKVFAALEALFRRQELEVGEWATLDDIARPTVPDEGTLTMRDVPLVKPSAD